MAATKSAPQEERVSVFIPKQAGEDPTVFVGVNNVNYLIPRGKKTEVPLAVARVLAMSEAAAEFMDTFNESEQKKMTVIQGAP